MNPVAMAVIIVSLTTVFAVSAWRRFNLLKVGTATWESRLTEIPKGCAFNPRCTLRGERCLVDRPELMAAGASRAACWLHDDRGVGPSVATELANA